MILEILLLEKGFETYFGSHFQVNSKNNIKINAQVRLMNDKIGRTIRRGQIVAIGKRQDNDGALDLGVVDRVDDNTVFVLYMNARYSFQDTPRKPRKGNCSTYRRVLIIDNLPRNENTEDLLDLRDDMRGDN